MGDPGVVWAGLIMKGRELLGGYGSGIGSSLLGFVGKVLVGGVGGGIVEIRGVGGKVGVVLVGWFSELGRQTAFNS
jgi:hypothetical protein